METIDLAYQSVDRSNDLAIMTVRVNRPTQVESKMVEPGNYMLVVNGDNMSLQNLDTNKVVAQAPVSWTQSSRTFNKTKLDVGQNDNLIKIGVGGTDQAIVLQNAAPLNAAPNSPAKPS